MSQLALVEILFRSRFFLVSKSEIQNNIFTGNAELLLLFSEN